jgi:hypothetical protein
MLGTRDGRTITFRETPREGRITAADRHEDGSLGYSLEGSSPQGEEDTLRACRLLVVKLNATGDSWDDPVKGEDVVDGMASDRRSKRKLCMQVVHAVIDQDFWRDLNKFGAIAQAKVSSSELATQLRNAIAKKSTDREIPRSLRTGLALVLDATRLPAHAFDGVIEEFHNQFGAWTASQGFDAVWLVGPQIPLIWRLDKSAPAGTHHDP